MHFNKALLDYDFVALAKQVTETYSAQVAGVLPLSTEVARLSSSDLFSLRFPDNQWSQTIKNIANQVIATG